MRCNNCGSSRLWSRGHSFKCKDCGHWTKKDNSVPIESFMEESSDGKGTYSTVTNEEIKTLEDLIRICKIDLDYWEIDRWICNKWGQASKDRNKEIQTIALFQVKVWLIKRTKEIKARSIFESLADQAKAFSPKYPTIKYPKYKDGMMYEIALPDMQLGRMVQAQATGVKIDLTPESMVERADRMMDELIGYVQDFHLDEIIFPIGNDFFDSDNLQMTTTHGTPQQDDPRWQKVFEMGVQLIRRTTDKLAALAPVKLIVVPGNHDETKAYFMGRELDAWYHNCPNVTVDNVEALRKYHQYKSNLICFTHGYHERGGLDSLMAYEVPQMWATSTHREIHLGDKHHKADMLLKTEEERNGVVVRILRSLSDPSVWEYNKGFVGSLKAAEGFLWHPDKGVIAQFTATE